MKLYHTYKKQVVELKPIKKGKIGMYNCGPTVYDYLQIGNFRTFLIDDMLRRALEYVGYDVKQVMNITDVGHLTMTESQKKAAQLAGKELEITDTDEGLDRMEKAAKREGLTVWEIADKYTEAIFGKDWEKKEEFGRDGDFGKMNILKPYKLPKATDHIKEQIDFIKRLEKKGYTYTTKKAVYFDIQKFAPYENLIGQSFSDMQKGKRADSSDPERKHPADFRLWQLGQVDHPMQWKSPWGKGFPGWHIECSAMSRKYLGQPFDIHTGGEDHIKLHHADEIAQSASAYDEPMANIWLHVSFLKVNGKRMGKSVGNAYTLDDLEKNEYDPLDLRYFFFLNHYRMPQNFTWKALKAARTARLKLINTAKRLAKSGKGKPKYQQEFAHALENDMHLPEALAVVWNVLKSKEKDKDKYATILDFDNVLGLRIEEEATKKIKVDKNIKKEIESLVKEREEARSNKDWPKADLLRKNLKDEYKVELVDTDEGTEWKVGK